LLSMEDPGSEGEFAVIREIAAGFARQKDFNRLIHFLTSKAINNPADEEAIVYAAGLFMAFDVKKWIRRLKSFFLAKPAAISLITANFPSLPGSSMLKR
ncbi:hypothetical protein, partial [Treponema sp. R6D11]